jgi:DNA-binding response OmpR family regulator
MTMAEHETLAVATDVRGPAVASVLVVDDDPGIVGFLELALGDEGYEVRVAANGREGLAETERRRPDVILLDMNMPVMDGWEFCQQLRRADADLDTIPIIVMTAARDAAARSNEVGAQGYLGKPFDLDHLFQTIETVLKGRDTASA